MSDASGQQLEAPASVASGTSTEANSPAQHQRGERLALIARILATAGALLFAVGAWMPWVVVTGYTFISGQQQDYTLALSPGDVKGTWGDSIGWSAITVLGILLVPLLWWRSQPVFTYVVLRLNILWVVISGLAGPRELSESRFSRFIRLIPGLSPEGLVITQRGPWLLGFWATLVGVVLMISSAGLSHFIRSELRREMRQRDNAFGERTPRPPVLLPGASALTIGIALWAVSTFVMPWASVNCTANPLIIGTCTGLSYTSVLQISIANTLTSIDPLVARYAVGLLLGGGAAMVLVGLWWRARSVAFCGWATLWLVLAAAFAWLADYGVGVVVEKHDALGLPAGMWSGENAVLVTLLGFVLALGGLGYLWVDALRNRGTRSVAS